MAHARPLKGGWARRRVLVTGAAGFIGSWLVKALLEQGARVTALALAREPGSPFFRDGDARRCAVVLGRLEDRRAVAKALRGADTVFHLGAQTLVEPAWTDPGETFESNIRGTYTLLEACRAAGRSVRRVVFASSDKAYGAQDRLPYRESGPLAGRQPYEVSKSCGDLLAQSYFHSYGLPVAVARCGNVYGGGDLHWSRIVPGTIRSLLRGQRPVLRSDGRDKRDYIYVKDVVRAYLLLADALEPRSLGGECFNFGPNRPLTVLALVRSITRLVGGRLAPDIRATARGEIRNQYLSSAKAARLLGWRPAYAMEEGLRETIAWYRKRLG